MAYRFQFRGRTAAEAATLNEVLLANEICIETDTMLYKFGDGSTPWNSLPYLQLMGEFPNALLMDAVENPSAPAAGKMLFYAHNIAGKIVPKWIGPSGLDNPVQSELAANGIQIAVPASGATLSYFGMGSYTVVGTVTHPNIVTGANLRQSMKRGTVTSAAAANSASELRNTVPMGYRGEVFGSQAAGGFYHKTRFAVASAVALQRCAVGLWSTLTATSVSQDPQALTNCIFAGWGSADANLQIMHNDASGACTKIDLGASFPANNLDTVYEFALFCPPNGDAVGYRVVRMDTGAVAAGLLSTNLPAKSTTLTYHAYMNNGGTAAAVALDFMRMYFESDY